MNSWYHKEPTIFKTKILPKKPYFYYETYNEELKGLTNTNICCRCVCCLKKKI